MEKQYELFEYDQHLPVHTSLHSVKAVQPHWHKEIEILLVLQGSIYLMLQNDTHRISKGSVAVINPSKIHFTQQTEEPNQVLTLHINSDLLDIGCAPEEQTSFSFHCIGNRHVHPQIVEIRKHMCAIVLELLYKQPGYGQMVLSNAQTILGILQRYFSVAVSKADAIDDLPGEARILRIVDYINTHYAQKLTLNDLAAREYLSLNYLSSIFRKHAGMSFTDYLNAVRLKAYISLMERDPEASLNDLSDRCGFSSPQYATKQFVAAYHMTPGKYRRELEKKEFIRLQSVRSGKAEGYVEVYNPVDLTDVLKYWIKVTEVQGAHDPVTTPGENRKIDCTVPSEDRYHRSAIKLCTIGRAYDGLLTHVQENLKTIQTEIGFTHLRFHGIFSDEMMILLPDITGNIRYSWRMVDMLLDFVRSIGLHPFIELTYMPSVLASGKETVFHWGANITPPFSLAMWCTLVQEFLRHCIARYGASEVAQWYFEVWNEPDYENVSWKGTREEFFYFYERTAKALREVFPQARVVGPSVSALGIRSKKWLSAFREHCEKTGTPVDAISFHAYPEIIGEENLHATLRRVASQPTGEEIGVPMMSPNFVTELVSAVDTQLNLPTRLPYIVTEWNITMACMNPINDSMLAATALLYEALSADDANLILGHWTVSDYLEEVVPLPAAEFHGGFGLMTVNGLRKPTYWAMWALSRLADEVVARFPEGIVTRSGNRYVLLAFNHPQLTAAYDMKFARALVADKLLQGETMVFSYLLQGLRGKWRLKRYHYRGYDCAARILMMEANMQEPLSREDLSYLSGRSQPIRNEEILSSPVDDLIIPFHLRLFEFEVVELTPFSD